VLVVNGEGAVVDGPNNGVVVEDCVGVVNPPKEGVAAGAGGLLKGEPVVVAGLENEGKAEVVEEPNMTLFVVG
jgi:hypothetical protein